MTIKFEQLSSASGFMKHNGGLLFRTISENQYEFKTTVTENHLNRVKITHGGYLASIIDAGLGTAASRCAGNVPCVTISLDIKYIAPSKEEDEIIGFTKILKKTKTLVFLTCDLKCNDKIIANASGVWKIYKNK